MFSFGKSRAQKREEQIQSISQFNPMARCTSPDRNTWDIGLKLPNGQVVTLRLFVARLPPLHYATLRLSSQASPRIRARIMSSRFPDVAPHLQILGATVEHPWLDSRSCVSGAPQLRSWRSSYLVGRVLKDIMDHFIRSPPAVRASPGAAGAPNPGVYPSARPGPQPAYYTQSQQQQQQQHANPPGYLQPHPHDRQGPPRPPPPPPSYGSSPSGLGPAFYTGAAGNRSVQPQQLQHQAQQRGYAGNGYRDGPASHPPHPPRLEEQHSMGERHTQMPPLPSTFPRLEELGEEELRRIASDAEACRAFVEGEPLVANHKDARNEAVEANRKVAREALEAGAQAEERRRKLEEMQAALQREKQELEALRERKKRVQRRYAPEELLKSLQQASAHAERLSDDVGEALEHGDIDLRTFEKDFLAHRATFHRRRALLACHRVAGM